MSRFELKRFQCEDGIQIVAVFFSDADPSDNFNKYIITLGDDNTVIVKNIQRNWGKDEISIICHRALYESEAKILRDKIIKAKDDSDFKDILYKITINC
ncbi:MAG: hypothetical protein JHC30_07610 [Caldisericum sp.]|nr:hypothetical protein [Caldisericum sp.]